MFCFNKMNIVYQDRLDGRIRLISESLKEIRKLINRIALVKTNYKLYHKFCISNICSFCRLANLIYKYKNIQFIFSDFILNIFVSI